MGREHEPQQRAVQHCIYNLQIASGGGDGVSR
eukprot:SAG11_NODE_33061_length_279_cov_0.850000_1_plen_31_part_01